MPVRHALEHVLKIRRIARSHCAGGGDEGADRRPAVGGPARSGKQVILAAKLEGTKRAFDINFDASELPVERRSADLTIGSSNLLRGVRHWAGNFGDMNRHPGLLPL